MESVKRKTAIASEQFDVIVQTRIGRASEPMEAFDAITRAIGRGGTTDEPTSFQFTYMNVRHTVTAELVQQ